MSEIAEGYPAPNSLLHFFVDFYDIQKFLHVSLFVLLCHFRGCLDYLESSQDLSAFGPKSCGCPGKRLRAAAEEFHGVASSSTRVVQCRSQGGATPSSPSESVAYRLRASRLESRLRSFQLRDDPFVFYLRASPTKNRIAIPLPISPDIPFPRCYL